MSFLNQLKSQAQAVQSEQTAQHSHHDGNTRLTEAAAKTAWLYVSELARQLNVIGPPGPDISLDGKAHWPAMKLVNFTVDNRKKNLRDQDVVDYIAIGWQIVPVQGVVTKGSISANFPPELNRIEARLAAGMVKHERVNVRHPVKDTLQAIRFDYDLLARGGVTIKALHDEAQFELRLANLQGLEIVNKAIPASQIQTPLLDELAKLICGQTSHFL